MSYAGRLSRGMRWLTSELDYRDGKNKKRFERGKAEVLTEYKESISIGQPMDVISELGNLDRQLLQDPSFFAVGNVILKKVTPEEELDDALVDASWIPLSVREDLLLMDLCDIDASALMGALRNAKKDPDALAWIAENVSVWDDSHDLDAMKDAEYGLDTIREGGRDEEDVLDEGIDQEDEGEDTLTETPKRVRKEFRPPRDRYRLADRFRPSNMKEAAEQRMKDFGDELQTIRSLGPVEEIEAHLSLLRALYQHDTHMLSEWSQERKKEDRALYSDVLRRRGLDEETIRAKLWACFDRQPEQRVIASQVAKPLKQGWYEHLDPNTGQVDEEWELDDDEIVRLSKRIGRDPTKVDTKILRIPPCIWEKERSRALCELNYTRGQWRKIYATAWEQMGSAIYFRAVAARSKEALHTVRMLMVRWQLRLTAPTRQKIMAAVVAGERRVSTVEVRQCVAR